MDTDTDSVTNTIQAEPVEETDDSCFFQYFEVVALDRDNDGSCTTECVSGDCPTEVKQEDMAVVKNEPNNVCCTILSDDGFSTVYACQFYAAFFKICGPYKHQIYGRNMRNH